MTMKEKFKNPLQFSMLQGAEIKDQINDGGMTELQELKKKNLQAVKKA